MIATRKQLLVTGIIQLIIGILCVIFGILERKSVNEMARTREYHEYLTLTTLFFLGIWAGLLIVITGVLGILTNVTSKCMTAVYLGFSITCIALAIVMILCYSISLSIKYSRADRYRSNLDYHMSILILSLSFLELGIGIWASRLCCSWPLECSCRKPQTDDVGQVVYIQSQGGDPPIAHVIIQGPDGNPVAVPAQTSGPKTEQSGIPPHYNYTTTT